MYPLECHVCALAVQSVFGQLDMWQSRIEIEYYFVTYFERITEFDAL